MKKYVAVLFVLGSFISCQQEESSRQDQSSTLDLNKTLPGTWELININVKVNTFENTDSAFVQEIKEEDYLSTLESIADKKLASLKNYNPKEQVQKLITYLQSKGYEYEYILKVLNKE